jgi:hypothetical protein
MDETVFVVCFFGALFVGCLWVANYLIEETSILIDAIALVKNRLNLRE